MFIRLAESRDLDELRQMYLTVRRSTYSWLDTSPYKVEDYDRDTEGETVWVACPTPSDVCGFISLWEPEPFIHHLYVARRSQKQGVGTALLWKGLATLGRPVRLKCLLQNEPALRFYIRYGWQRVAEHTGPDGRFVLMQYQEESNITLDPDV